ncbi:MAG: RluA family pseudouridine synthase [Planctomycetes bacterium]|nr:RluA family pseudouridine synthase [Planctomycetota bacterium]
MLRIPVAETQQGILLQDLLEAHWPDAHRAALRGLVRDGRVRVNRQPARPQQRLRPGDLVEVDAEHDPGALRASRAAAARDGLAVLYEDPALLVIDKPAGLPTVPDRVRSPDSVHARLPALRPGADLRIVHRLDRDTSGCLLLAKGVAAARALDVAFRERRVRKEYLALVLGELSEARSEVHRALGPDPRRPGKMVVVAADARRARPAHSEIVIEERFARYTLVRVIPHTGRTHQIRVHLSSLHHPIVGDADYGGGEGLRLSELKPGYKQRRGVTERPLVARAFLHAQRVTLESPAGGAVAVAAPLPRDLETVLEKLRRFAPPRRRTPCG